MKPNARGLFRPVKADLRSEALPPNTENQDENALAYGIPAAFNESNRNLSAAAGN